MALRTPLSVTPHLYMGDSTGRPLDKGVVYFGEQDKDPEFYPINLFSDDALTLPLAQPVHTKGGYLYDKGDMVEPHAKELIYSVKVLDSYGRKVFYKGAMMRNSWNDDVIEQINAAIIGSADVARQVATDITNEAINNTAIDGGVLADTFVTVTSNAPGSVPRNQRDKNSERMTIADFGGDIVAAGNWVKQSVSNYCYLRAGETYTISDAGEVFFNRMICTDGLATVVVPHNVNLFAVHKTDGSEVVHLEGVEYIVEGHRAGVAGGTTNLVYKNQSNITVANSFIARCNVYALLNSLDKSSYVDNAGQTRAWGFIYLKVAGHAEIRDVSHYGFGVFYALKSASPSATHIEKNVIGYNNQTNIFISTSNFAWGESSDLSIINTPTQKSYYIDKNTQVINGKDVLLCEADHTSYYKVGGIYAEHAIERDCYIHSGNVFLDGSVSKGSDTGAHIKTSLQGLRAEIKNLLVIDFASEPSTAGSFATYGYDYCDISDIKLTADTEVDGVAVILQDSGDITIRRGYIKDKGAAFIYNERAIRNTSSILITDITLDNCKGLFYTGTGMTGTRIDNLIIENVKNVKSKISRLNTSALSLKGVGIATLKNVSLSSFSAAFDARDCESLSIEDSVFDIYSPDDTFTTLTKRHGLSETYRNQGVTGFSANTFDFTINLLNPTATPRYEASVRFKRGIGSDKVHCGNYWHSVSGNMPNPLADTNIKVFYFDELKSFRLVATQGASRLELMYAGAGSELTLVSNSGQAFAVAANASKAYFVLDPSYKYLAFMTGESWVATGANVTFDILKV